jgi:hypothetical protein
MTISGSRWWLSLFVLMVVGSCDSSGASDGGDAGIDAGGGDVDSDADGDVDGGGDADADGDGDGGASEDGGMDGGGGQTWDPEFETDGDWEPQFDTDVGAEQTDETWTIMLYEDADNNLENVLLDDVNEAERAELPDNVNVIVLLDRAAGYDKSDGNWKGAKLFQLAHDTTPKQINSPRLADPEFLGLTDDSEDGEELDMGSPETLEGFIDFCQKNFPADHYILHLSDHGDGWRKQIGPVEEPGPVRATCSDDSSGNSLTISEDIPAAIAGKGLEAITFDACSLGTLEVAWALAPHTDFAAISVMTVPGTGWQYDVMLNAWSEFMTAKAWVLVAVEAYRHQYTGTGNVGFTALDLRPMAALLEEIDAFVAATEGIPTEELVKVRNAAFRPDRLTAMPMRDFSNLIRRAEGYVGSDVVDRVLNAYDEIILYYWYTNNLAKCQGLTIYAPGKGFLQGGPYKNVYDETPFARDTTWDEFVQSLL